MSGGGPYRDGGTPEVPVDPDAWRTRFVCIVCFAESSPRPGGCPRDGAALADLRRPDVEWALRAFAQARLDRIRSRYTWRRLGLLIGLPLVGLTAMRLGGCHLYAAPPRHGHAPGGGLLVPLLLFAAWMFTKIVCGDGPANVPTGFDTSHAPLDDVLGWLAL